MYETETNLPSVTHDRMTDDGWADAAAESAERVLKGTLLKFADRMWSAGKEGTPIEDGKQLVAVGTSAAWVRWNGGKPVEYRVRQPGRNMPDRDELGDPDESAWEAGPDGQRRNPWQSTRFVYLIEPQTAEAFTFSTSSWGGRGAVTDLGDQIARMRYAHPGAVPIVELGWAPMQTKFGKKSKPVLKVVGWKNSRIDEELPQIEHQPNGYAELKARGTKSTVSEVELEDQIPF